MWNLFSAGLGGATGSVVGNAGLVKKVDFPARSSRSPRSAPRSCTSSCRALVLFAALARRSASNVDWAYMPLLVPALVALLLLAAALGILLAAINVYMRDMQHMLELRAARVVLGHADRLRYFRLVDKRRLEPHVLVLLNPVDADRAHVPARDLRPASSFTDSDGQHAHPARLLGRWRYLALLGVVAVRRSASLCSRSSVFGRLEGNFAEEL